MDAESSVQKKHEGTLILALSSVLLLGKYKCTSLNTDHLTFCIHNKFLLTE